LKNKKSIFTLFDEGGELARGGACDPRLREAESARLAEYAIKALKRIEIKKAPQRAVVHLRLRLL